MRRLKQNVEFFEKFGTSNNLNKDNYLWAESVNELQLIKTTWNFFRIYRMMMEDEYK